MYKVFFRDEAGDWCWNPPEEAYYRTWRPDELERMLNAHAEEGWRIVTAGANLFILEKVLEPVG